ncbi:MAG: hypothetical protein ACI8WT_004434 [Clostridium sp.]|jgi:hypothetical protein
MIYISKLKMYDLDIRNFYLSSYENEVELQKDILKSALVVLEWTESLPVLK